MAQARVEIRVVGDKQAAASIDRVNAAQRRLEGGTRRGAAATAQATEATRKFNVAQQQAKERLLLLGQQFGTAVPTAIQNSVVQFRTLTKVINAAFAISIGAFFIQGVLLPVLRKTAKLIDRMRGITKELERQKQLAIELNRLAPGTQTLGSLINKAAQLRREIAGLEKDTGGFLSLLKRLFPLDPFKRDLARLKEARKELDRVLQAIGELQVKGGGGLGFLKGSADILTVSLVNLADAMGRVRFFPEGRPTLFRPETIVGIESFNNALRSLLAIQKQATPAQRAMNDAFAAESALLQQLPGEIESLTVAQLTGVNRILAARDLQLEKLDELLERHRDNAQVVELLERKRVLIMQGAARQIEEANRQAFEQMSAAIDSFFQRAALGAQSFGDFFKQIWTQLLSFFTSVVSRMVAAWLLGQGRIRAASSGGLGGILGSIFGGGGFPIPGLGSGGTGDTASTTAAPVTAGAGISSQFNASLTRQVGGAGGATATNIAAAAPFSRLLGAAGVTGLAGGLISGFAGPNPILGGLGGFLSGGALGLLAGPAGLGIIPGVLGAFAGPIGALIGLGLGLFGAFGRRGKLKRAAARTEGELTAFMGEVIQDVIKFQLTAEQGVQQVQDAFEQFQQAVKPLGFAGRRAVRNISPLVSQVIADLELLGQQRAARGALIGGLGIPEFAGGGFVTDQLRTITSGQGKILAFLHGGEAVLNAGAVQRLGRSFIEQANRAPSLQDGGMVGRVPSTSSGLTVNITVTPAPGMNERQLADFTIRRLKRELEDRGMGLG